MALFAGTAPDPPISDDYRNHLRKYIPVLRSYKLNDTAAFFQEWVDDELKPAPLLDVSALLGLLLLNLI